MHSTSLLIKPVSSNCNMKCSYCFYNDIANKRKKVSYGKMNEETLENLVKKAIASSELSCSFAFQGGEPTLAGLEFYEKFLEFVNKYNENNIKTYFSIQTNGLLIDEKWAEFFKKNNFLVGLSLDGDKSTHDLFRVDKEGKGTYNRVMKTVDLFDKHKVAYNILTVVTSQLAKHPQRVYNFYKRKNFGFVQFIPVIEPYEEYNISHPYSLKPKEYAYFLKVLFDNWERDLIKGKYISIRLFDNLVRMIGGYPPQACEMNGMCSIQNVIEADGSIYPCDFYVFEKYKLGNINEIKNMEEILKSKTAKEFITSSLEVPDECRNCEWYSLCRNGCKRYRYDGKKYYFCNAYKEFFEYSYERLKKISESITSSAF